MPDMETNAVKLDDGSYVCPKCKGNEFYFRSHIDCTDQYINIYGCLKCDEGVFVVNKRSKVLI